jgi:glucosamine-6-phosphate deaminase
MKMKIDISETKQDAGVKAAREGAQQIRQAIDREGTAQIVLAAAASQFEMFAELVTSPEIDWSKVTAFHLDEYVGLPPTHPASFRRFLTERFINVLPQPLADFHFIQADNDLKFECRRIGDLLNQSPTDVAFIGIGENGHIAFNDPPADFTTREAYLVVDLDEACRRQQLGEGWFPALDDVPTKAISMSAPQIFQARRIVCTVLDKRKAGAVRDTVQGPVTTDVPASILQDHPAVTLYLDHPAASLLRTRAGETLMRQSPLLPALPARR